MKECWPLLTGLSWRVALSCIIFFPMQSCDIFFIQHASFQLRLWFSFDAVKCINACPTPTITQSICRDWLLRASSCRREQVLGWETKGAREISAARLVPLDGSVALIMLGFLTGGHLEASTLILCVWLLMWLQVGESWEECAAREVFAATNLLIEDVSFAAVVNSPHVDGDPYKHCVTIFLTGRTSSSSTSSLSLSSSGDNNSLSSVSSSATKSSKRDTFPINTEGRGMWQWMTWTEALSLRHFTPPILFEPLINLIENCQERPF